jgi:hypothetical protein
MVKEVAEKMHWTEIENTISSIEDACVLDLARRMA